mgnify:CR=1 FL=1
MIPTQAMLDLVAAARYAIATSDAGVDVAIWCAGAGLVESQFDDWVAEFGDGFISWFTAQLKPQPLELAVMDRQWLAGFARAINESKPNATALKYYGEWRGFFDTPSDPVTIPVLSEAEAWALLIRQGPTVLRKALEQAEVNERIRLEGADKQEGK